MGSFPHLGLDLSVLLCLVVACCQVVQYTLSDLSDSDIVGSESTGSFVGNEFGEERLNFHPPQVLLDFLDLYEKSCPNINMPFRLWAIRIDRMESLVVGQFLDRRHLTPASCKPIRVVA